MPFQNIFIDVGEETAIALPIADPMEEIIRTQEIEGFEKYYYTKQIEENDQVKIVPDPSLFKTSTNPSSIPSLHGCSSVYAMKRKLTQDFGDSPYKLFTVVNRNTAHQMSFFLADFAFRKFGNPGRKKVVINIDQHTDYGPGRNPNPSQYSIWGENVVSTDTTTGLTYDDTVYGITNYARAAYISAGNFYITRGEPIVRDISVKTANKINGQITSGQQKLKPDFTFEAFNKQKRAETYKVIEKFLLNQIFLEDADNPIDYYITLDTDAMCGSNTRYDSGILNNMSVLRLINKILRNISIYGDSLTGIDITGLPIRNGYMEKTPFDFPNYDDSIQQINKVVTGINRMLVHYNL